MAGGQQGALLPDPRRALAGGGRGRGSRGTRVGPPHHVVQDGALLTGLRRLRGERRRAALPGEDPGRGERRGADPRDHELDVASGGPDDRQDPLPLPHHRRPRGRGDGRGVSGHRHQPRPRRGDQGAASEVVEDPERLGRFQREAHLLAALNHPNIAAIYGLEEADGKPFLALELVEGEELKERLERGAIPVDEALEIAEQIAEALEEAHNKGIVHRDLKPANVKITPEGKVKVLDFGLAKAWAGDALDGSSSSAALSQSPTMANTGTVAGLILGTAAYMSPEQARGKPVDKRADVWSFGVLLWEMLTGRTLFAGDTVTDIIASVVKEEPDLDALPAATPHAVRRLLARCLRKDPRTRLPDIGAARLELQEAIAGTATEVEAPAADTAAATGERAPPSNARAVGLGRGRGGPGDDRRGPSLPAPDSGAGDAARRALRRRDARGPGLPRLQSAGPLSRRSRPRLRRSLSRRHGAALDSPPERTGGPGASRDGGGRSALLVSRQHVDRVRCRGRNQEDPPRGRDRPPGLRAPPREQHPRGHMECRGHDRLLGRGRNREPVLGLGGGRGGPAPHPPRRVAGRNGPLDAAVPARRAPPPLRGRQRRGRARRPSRDLPRGAGPEAARPSGPGPLPVFRVRPPPRRPGRDSAGAGLRRGPHGDNG